MELLGTLLGRVACFFAPFFLVPIIYGLLMGESGAAIFLLAGVIVLMVGIGLLRAGKITHRIYNLSVSDGAIFVSFSWLFLTVLGLLPFLLWKLGENLPVDVFSLFFEVISSLTTTGMTNITVELPPLLIFWRALLSFFGGMFFVMLMLTVLPIVNGDFGITSSSRDAGSFSPVISRLTDPISRVVVFFILLAVIWSVIFSALGLSPLAATTLALYAVVTGGGPAYGTVPEHISVIIAISAVSILSSMSVFLWRQMLRERSLRPLKKDPELRGFFGVILLAGIILSVYFAALHTLIIEAVGQGFFYAISFLSTNSFLLDGYEHMMELPDFWRLFCMGLSMVGGMVASTAGGIGMLRAMLLVSLWFVEIRRTLHPRMSVAVRLGDTVVTSRVAGRILFMVFIYTSIMLVGAIVLSFYFNEPIEALAVALSCMFSSGGIAMFFGVVNLEILPIWAKFFCSLLMILGRIEVIAFLVLLESMWENKQNSWRS